MADVVLGVTHVLCCSQLTVGVIVRMEKETFKVLSQHGKELSVPQHAVQPRKTRAVALDCHQVSYCI